MRVFLKPVELQIDRNPRTKLLFLRKENESNNL